MHGNGPRWETRKSSGTVLKRITGRLALYATPPFLAGLSLLGLQAMLACSYWVVRGVWPHPEDGGRLYLLYEYLGRIGGVLAVIGFLALFLDLLIIHNLVFRRRPVREDDLSGAKVVVGMTAYNDEQSIGPAVTEFLSHPRVSEVVVVDNNCVDGTAEKAARAGATVVPESNQGYGHACMRALKEASRGEILVLVEGDGTFSVKDLDKMLAYLSNFDMVVGTRTTRELNNPDSQVDWFLNPGNQIVAKLLQIRFWGTRFTDMGCTFRAVRLDGYHRFANTLHVGGNHFAPHMTIQALRAGLHLVEIPVSFKARVGHSKGVGQRKFRGVGVGLRMCGLIFRS